MWIGQQGVAVTKIIIRIPIVPVPFARAGSNQTRRFTPPKQANFMGEVRMFAERAMAGRAPLEGPLGVDALFFYAPPASWPLKKVRTAVWKESKPDVDNLLKICADALEGCAYHNDAQIASLRIHKIYGPAAFVQIAVRQLVDADALSLFDIL
jgi:Holliday junction resolvase RusA-like endonuclease